MPPARLRAPIEQGGVLIEPPLEQAGELIHSNQALLRDSSLQILGQPLSQLRALARAEVHALAGDYLHEIGIHAAAGGDAGFIVTGHQPELFHPGVWIKNFSAAGLARRHGLAGLHLIVDNDVVKATSIAVPDLRASPIRAVRVPFDISHDAAPFEEHDVVDEEAFARFPDAVAERLHGTSFQPMLPHFWDHARQLTQKRPRLGERLAGARRLQEEAWGCRNLELPLSRLCRSESFAWFSLHILEDLPRFHALHNRCLLEYRRNRHIRSRNHPVPTLGVDGDWLEAPFWVWRRGVGNRQRLFARATADTLELRLGENITARIPRDGTPERAIEGLRELETSGFKIRTRALTTTLFARLFLADLFIHGIGGAIYDELTDAIVREFYGIEPPRFLTLSATLRLPFPQIGSSAGGQAAAQRALRDIRWNPDRHLSPRLANSPEVLALQRQKQEWIEQTDPKLKLPRFHALRRINDELQPLAEGARDEMEGALAALTERSQAEGVLRNREYAFCLHPEEKLLRLFLPFLQVTKGQTHG